MYDKVHFSNLLFMMIVKTDKYIDKLGNTSAQLQS